MISYSSLVQYKKKSYIRSIDEDLEHVITFQMSVQIGGSIVKHFAENIQSYIKMIVVAFEIRSKFCVMNSLTPSNPTKLSVFEFDQQKLHDRTKLNTQVQANPGF
jgi:hypothetical protein